MMKKEIKEEERDKWEILKDEIKKLKRTTYSDNKDYLTGFLSALSNIDGIMAEIE